MSVTTLEARRIVRVLRHFANPEDDDEVSLGLLNKATAEAVVNNMAQNWLADGLNIMGYETTEAPNGDYLVHLFIAPRNDAETQMAEDLVKQKLIEQVLGIVADRTGNPGVEAVLDALNGVQRHTRKNLTTADISVITGENYAARCNKCRALPHCFPANND